VKKWKDIDKVERSKYNKAAKEDKSRYEQQMIEYKKLGYYTIISGPNAGLKSYEIANNIRLPKNPLNAYCFFRQEMIKKLKLKLHTSVD
jgi:hypothetical protein